MNGSASFGGVTIERKVPCATRDGVTLYADVYRPSAPGEYPVLLMRQPYGRAIASTVSHAHPVWYAHHGYIVVIQDVRGRGDSEGEFVPFLHEAEDGYDAVEWAASLPFSNGRVGMYGFSYQGCTQWAAASLHPPHLVAIAPSMCAADLYHGMFYPYGRFAIREHLPWAFQLARDEARRRGDRETEQLCTHVMRNPEELIRRLPVLEQHPVLSEYFPYYYEWCGHPEYDGYWERRNWLPAIVDNPVPSLQIGGWYDGFLMGTLQSYEALQRAPRRRELFHRLIIGPWAHIPWGRKAGGTDHGPLADGNIHLEQVQWFDYWLKGKRDKELFEAPPIRYFELASNRWRTCEQTSPFRPRPTSSRWYISGSEKPANGALGGGRLTDIPKTASAAPDVFVYDARLPMPCESVLPVDRSAVQDRFEILVYTSERLAETLHVFGAPTLSIRYQTMGGPTDLVAVLTMLTPDGTSRFLSVGRAEIGSEEEADAEGWRRVEIRMRPFAAEFRSGTSIRLELTGSAFPLFVRHPNGIPAAEIHRVGPDGLRIATVAVCSSGGDSCLELPVIRD